MAIVRARPSFTADLRARIEWIAENRDEAQLDTFALALEFVRDRIARYPEGGAIVRRGTRTILRRRLFPRPLPYLVYYAHPAPGQIEVVYLTRLFGAGQRREKR